MLIPESLTNPNFDAVGGPIQNPRANSQVLNVLGDGEIAVFPDSIGDIRSLTLAIYNNGTSKTIIPSNGQGTLVAISNNAVGGGSIFTVNGVETSDLEQGWNICTFNYGQNRNFSGAQIQGTSGSFLLYEADRILTLSEAIKNYKKLKSIYRI